MEHLTDYLEMLERNVNNPAQSDKAKSLMRKFLEQIKTENNNTVVAHGPNSNSLKN